MYYIDFATVTKLIKFGRQNTIRRGSKWYDIFNMHHVDGMQEIEYLRSPFGLLQVHKCYVKVFADLSIPLLCGHHSVPTGMCDLDVYEHILEQMKFCYEGFEEDEMVSVIWFTPIKNI